MDAAPRLAFGHEIGRRDAQRRTKPAREMGYVPPGWPRAVLPPAAPQWQASATAFLFDCCPSDCRQYVVLRRHPIVLARFALTCVEAQVAACTSALAVCRADLDGLVEPEVVNAAVLAWHEQIAALERTRREVSLVQDALRGQVFIRKI